MDSLPAELLDGRPSVRYFSAERNHQLSWKLLPRIHDLAFASPVGRTQETVAESIFNLWESHSPRGRT
jgi:hypothetical protein